MRSNCPTCCRGALKICVHAIPCFSYTCTRGGGHLLLPFTAPLLLRLQVAGFTKETAYWLKSVWLSNISKSDAGRPLGISGDAEWTTFIIESWLPPLQGSGTGKNRTINVYSNAPKIRLELNGRLVGAQDIPFFGQATFSVAFAEGKLTAYALDSTGSEVDSHSISSTGAVAAVQLSIDAPSAATGTGDALVADGEDTAMVRATLVDSQGLLVPGSNNNITFTVLSGPGRIWSTHNGDPANVKSNDEPCMSSLFSPPRPLASCLLLGKPRV